MSPDVKTMLRPHLEAYALNLEERCKEERGRIGELRRELDKLRDVSESEDSLSSGRYVIFSMEKGYPHCSEHGAMLCVNEERTIWRCSTCHLGADLGQIHAYIRREKDITLIFDDKELVATVKTGRFKKAMEILGSPTGRAESNDQRRSSS